MPANPPPTYTKPPAPPAPPPNRIIKEGWGIFKQPDLVETVYVLYVKQSVCRIEFNEEIGDMTTQQFMKIIENTYSKCYTATMMCELEFDEKDNSFLAFTLKLVPTI